LLRMTNDQMECGTSATRYSAILHSFLQQSPDSLPGQLQHGALDLVEQLQGEVPSPTPSVHYLALRLSHGS
jgi:hypothetical protein